MAETLYTRQYTGIGKLQNGKQSPEFAFEAGQTQDGRIVLICTLEEIRPNIGSYDNISFEGTTDTGKRITISGPTITANTSLKTNREGLKSTVTTYKFHGETYIKVGDYLEEEFQELRFAVTNLEFIGTDSEEIAPNHFRLNTIKLNVDGVNVQIHQVNDYQERLKSIEASEGINVTCEIVVPVSTGMV